MISDARRAKGVHGNVAAEAKRGEGRERGAQTVSGEVRGKAGRELDREFSDERLQVRPDFTERLLKT